MQIGIQGSFSRKMYSADYQNFEVPSVRLACDLGFRDLQLPYNGCSTCSPYDMPHGQSMSKHVKAVVVANLPCEWAPGLLEGRLLNPKP